jgi:hypothetical protein
MEDSTFRERLSTIISPLGVMMGTFSAIISSSDSMISPSIKTKKKNDYYYYFSNFLNEPAR